MKGSRTVFRVGTRPSRLSLSQTRDALDRIERFFDGISFEMVEIASAGDADRETDLRVSPEDFFTRELDSALIEKEIDCAIHSAKDLPGESCAGLDWFWLPWHADQRDVLVLPRTRDIDVRKPVVGITSERRAEYCKRRFPKAIQKPVRGDIEQRIAKLDVGEFDVLIMAAAGLCRLGLEDRISEWIALEELPVPDGQGVLAVTFRAEDARMRALRDMFVKSVTFAGAGVGRGELCAMAVGDALRRCDVCLYDSLMDLRLLELMPKNAEKVHVGKRCGQHTKAQDEITRLICEHARRGRKVVRLKGGDPGIFGRLTEEVDALETLGIPFHVIPGISALQVATTGTGMLLTRRGVSRGFCALTSRRSGGITASINSVARAALPVVFFMAIESISKVVEELISDGTASGTPAAVVFDAGGDDELLVKASLGDISSAVAKIETSLPGLLIVGEITQFGFARTDGALAGRRILLTCSAALQRRAVDMVRDFGGHPLCCPLIRITPNLQALEDISDISSNDWIVITSPSAVRCLMEMLKADIRRIPRIMVCGAGTARELKRYGVFPDAMPESGYGAESIFETAKKLLISGDRVLRLRSDKAGAWLAEKMRALGAEVNDCTLYKNEPVICEKWPDFDCVFFASSSAVSAFIKQCGSDLLAEKTVLVIGRPTARELERHGVQANVVADEATVAGAVRALAVFYVQRDMER